MGIISIMTTPTVNDPSILDKIHELVDMVGVKNDTYEGELASQIIKTALRLLLDDTDLGQMKLITRSLKEMRYAYRTFSRHPSERRVSIFGSARTPDAHPDYKAALDFSHLMSAKGWTCITGAADGIMKAGLEGAAAEQRFGLSIRLPWETGANPLINKDPKLIMFRYFFTRKLMFVSQSNAFAAFPGGFGTMDELFEVLTLMQTGKAEIMPIVLIEGMEGTYWQHWESYVEAHLMANGWISEIDKNLYHIAKDPKDAAQHILHFYSNYQSSRYVREHLVIRLLREPSDKLLKQLSHEFASLIERGEIKKCDPFPEETDDLEYCRITFVHSHKDFGLLRLLIDRLNDE